MQKKLQIEDKVKIYELRQNGESIKSLSDQFSIAESGIQYMIRLIDRYGVNIVKKGKNTYYSPELKQEMIDKVFLKQQSKLTVSLDYALPNRGTLPNWIAQYKKNGYTILEKARGRPPKNTTTSVIQEKKASPRWKIRLGLLWRV